MIGMKIHYIIFQNVNHTKNIKREDFDEQRHTIFVRDKRCQLKAEF